MSLLRFTGPAMVTAILLIGGTAATKTATETATATQTTTVTATATLTRRGYSSPLPIPLDPQIGAWTSDFPQRTNLTTFASTPSPSKWYSTNYPAVGLTYGPLNPQLYSIPAGVSSRPNLGGDRGTALYNVPLNAIPSGVNPGYWRLQRLYAAARLLVGTPYQHLHLPQFNPALVTPAKNFNWMNVSQNMNLQTSQQLYSKNSTPIVANPYRAVYGRPTAGIDCTDFAAYIYNLALGVQMHSGVSNQIQFNNTQNKPAAGVKAFATVYASNGTLLRPSFIYAPQFGLGTRNTVAGYSAVISQLRAGDLLYMGSAAGGITHVVVWLGINGTDSAGNSLPLIISSHDNTPAIFDTAAITSSGYPIDGNIARHLPPPGVQVLPFTPVTWFYQAFQVAMRVLSAL